MDILKFLLFRHNTHKSESTSGFTLIELLVVIIIIGILSAIIMTTSNSISVNPEVDSR